MDTSNFYRLPGAVTLDDLFGIAIGHHEAGRIGEADAAYRRILELDPDHADSLHLLGLILDQAGQSEPAIQLIGRAIEINPDAAHYHNNLGNAYHRQGRLPAATEHYRRAAELRPDSAEIASNLGTVLREAGKAPEAVSCYRAALRLCPGSPDILYNLANALTDLGNAKEAEACYRASIAQRPDHTEAYYNLGNLLIDLRRWRDAEAAYRKALELAPDQPAALNNLGTVLQELGFPDEAERRYRQALHLLPTYADAHYNLGCICQVDGRLDEAAACYERALAIDPDYGAARVAFCMAQLPVLYRNELEIFDRRTLYLQELRRLCKDAGTTISLEKLAEGVGASQPFFLAYQGYNDRALQQIYGDLLCSVMAARYPTPPLNLPSPRCRKIRIGIVSGFFHDHTIWKLFIEGWLKQFDRKRFEIFGYHTGTIHDEETDLATALCAGFAEGGRSTSEWRHIILKDRPDVLLYPEIGMDPMAARLGAMRLAPLQCVSWGHPETTGLATIDVFLSNALMEPPSSAAHYSENLVLMPNLSIYYEPSEPSLPALDRSDFGMRRDATIYWSGQAIYKYLPQFDPVFPQIALAAGDCQFVFIQFAKSQAITDLLRSRMDQAFASVGLDAADYCLFLPPMDQARFLAAIGQADVLLDTIGWSGGKSTLDSLSQNPAIVTLETGLMRGRHTAAILRRMQATETIAHSIDDYVAKAVQLGRDPDARRAIRAKVARNKGQVFRDRSYITALETFLAAKVNSGTDETSAAVPRPESGRRAPRRLGSAS
jgi:predicted O-linked N-acetylglucosamine transferase (SPINDLY family)